MSNDRIFIIEHATVGATAVLRLHGELDLETAPELADEVSRVLDRRPVALALDCRELAFMDSSGINVLVRAESRSRREGIRFCLVAASPPVRRLLALCGLDERFDIVDDLGAAGDCMALEDVASAYARRGVRGLATAV